MHAFVEEDGPFNVVVVYEYPVPGGMNYRSAVENKEPLTLEEAKRWNHRIKELVDLGKGMGAIGSYTEMSVCPRPFTREILRKLCRVQVLDKLEEQEKQALPLPSENFWVGRVAPI